MEFKGTKGEWYTTLHNRIERVYNEERVLVAECDHYKTSDFYSPTPLACKHNAKLIAAAPDLLEAVISLLENNTHLELDLDSVDKGEKAIEKALK